MVTINDEAATDCMRLLAEGRYGDTPLIAGESAVAGLAGLLAAAGNDEARATLDLRKNSRVVLFGTEGAEFASASEVIHTHKVGMKAINSLLRLFLRGS